MTATTPLDTPPPIPHRSGLTRGDRGALWVVCLLATAYGLAVLVAGIIAAVDQLPVLSGGPTSLTVLTDGDVPTAGLNGTAALLGGSFTEATLRVEGLSSTAAGLMLAGSLAATLTQLVVVAAVLLLGIRLLRGGPFLRSLTIAATVAAATVLVGGVASQVLAGVSRMMVVAELSDDVAASVLEPGFLFDPTPFAVGLGLAVVAAAFQVAERLQRDTEGLV